MPPGCLFYDSQNIALSYNDVFLSIQLYFCSCIFGIDDLLSGLYLHGNFLAVYHSARTYGDYLCLLRLLLCTAGKNNTRLCGLLCLTLF